MTPRHLARLAYRWAVALAAVFIAAAAVTNAVLDSWTRKGTT